MHFWELEVKEVDNLDVGRHGDGDVHDFAQDLHEAHNNPLFSKRRKVKSTRYTEFSEEMINMSTPHNTKADKRSRNTEKYIEEDNADYVSTVANSKEALIASIFFVFDTLGKNGLTASEVVAIMLEQNLPGLKEGGARHTVQVANVLRRSRHFISIGNKQYLPCSVAEVPKQEAKKQGHSRNGQSSKSKQGRADCKLYDGSGWHCPRQAQHAFSLCLHHLDMINRPFGKMSVTPSIKGSPVHVREVSNSQRVESEESESDPGENEDIGPAAIARWGKDRTPGSMPNQKRKMLSLMSIK
uniref:WRC domain-containing protein n=1 Tax=Physcomitrium patens TaxID=3218 RepID=A0A7I4CMF5_PHYPA